MKISIRSLDSTRSRSAGFTLPEVLIALTIFLFVIAGILSANLFGLRMFQANQTKLNATEWSRAVFGKMSAEIRSCDTVAIGSFTTNGWAGLLPGELQQGNAIQILRSAGTTNSASTNSVYYFLDTQDGTFRRTETVSIGASNTLNAVILAQSVTNTIIFSAQNFSGRVLTNDENRLIHLLLEFYEPGSFMRHPYYYRLETSMTRRALQ